MTTNNSLSYGEWYSNPATGLHITSAALRQRFDVGQGLSVVGFGGYDLNFVCCWRRGFCWPARLLLASRFLLATSFACSSAGSVVVGGDGFVVRRSGCSCRWLGRVGRCRRCVRRDHPQSWRSHRLGCQWRGRVGRCRRCGRVGGCRRCVRRDHPQSWRIIGLAASGVLVGILTYRKMPNKLATGKGEQSVEEGAPLRAAPANADPCRLPVRLRPAEMQSGSSQSCSTSKRSLS